MTNPSVLPGGEWEDVYRHARPEELPWFTAQLDDDFERALARYRILPRGGPALDLGTGPGTAAIELARRGFAVTALDVSPSAIRMARKRAGDLGARIEWVAADFFHRSWDVRFQLVYDRGLYHTLSPPLRHQYPERIAQWLKPHGYLIIKTFSTDEPGEWGPFRIGRDELETNIGGRLDLLALEASAFPGTLDHQPRAWFGVYRNPQAP